MNDVKFRGLTKEGKWVYGSLLAFDINRTYIVERQSGIYLRKCDYNFSEAEWHITKEDVVEVLPETVGQYTGRKEIYDGDRVSFTVFDHNGIDSQYTGVVYYDERDLAWNIRCETAVFSLGSVMTEDDELKVIGNIYEEAKI